MSFVDAQNLFSDKQNLAQAAGSYLSTYSIDLGAPGTDVQGNAAPSDPGGSTIGIFCRASTGFTTSAGGTIQVQLVTADSADLATNLTVLQQTDVIPAATAAAGYRFFINEIPVGVTQRYIGLRYVIGTGAMTAGNIYAGLTTKPQT